MSIQADIKTALDAAAVTAIVGSAGVFTDAAPQDKELPLIVWKRMKFEQVMTLVGPASTANSIYLFECWASTKAAAMALASAVSAAIEAAASLTNKYRLPYEGEEYEPTSDQFCEPIQYSFWHDT